ncbi:hypothetical protein Ocin01_19026 [Orchesella cincta]|uniref:Uncharacterized protein n=1 Tax=Orchesella cincta TaxID=48709 RepID=A0A1D2M3X9_ORCCI|nr:hypothetical protein Ocin01_19026 [Orchesella cincta]
MGETGGYRSSSSSSPSDFLDEEENTLLAQQLHVIFILKRILKLKDDEITRFLGMLDGQFNPEFWFQLCQSCGASVKEYFDTLKEVNRLKKRLTTISDGLKTKIEKTKESHQDAERDGDEEEISKSVWKQIRMETLNNMTDPDAEPLSKFQMTAMAQF